jgi:hypothetical protein
MSLAFGFAVGLRVVIGCLKLIRLSERLSHMSGLLSYHLSWLIAQLGGSAAAKQTRHVRYSHAPGELIRVSTRLSLYFESPADPRVVVGCLKLIRRSERLSHMSCRLSYPCQHDLQDHP